MTRAACRNYVLCAVVITCAGAAVALGQTGPPIAVGEIDLIDHGAKLLVLRTVNVDGDGGFGGIAIGLGGADACRMPGPFSIPDGASPRPGGAPPPPGPRPGASGTRNGAAYQCITVRAGVATVIGRSGAYRSFESLRRGQEVSVRGRAYGDEIEATEITVLDGI